jgi:hypothetical protein
MTADQVLEDADVFLDVALGDDDFVRAEFDALIAACWESPCEPPLDKPGPSVGGWAAGAPPPGGPRPPPPPAPIPRDPPVTIATLPSSFPMCFPLP